MFNKIKARYLWILALVLFLIGIGLIFLIPILKLSNTTPIVIVLVIIFLAVTFLVQSATYKSFSYKNKKKYIIRKYEGNKDIEEALLNNGFKSDKEEFGKSYYYKDNDRAYKVSVITKSSTYFNLPEADNKNKKPVVDFSNCKRLAGIELFIDVTDEVKDKSPDFTINTKTFSYIALLYNGNNEFILNNYEKIEDPIINDMMNYLLKTLGLNLKEE